MADFDIVASTKDRFIRVGAAGVMAAFLAGWLSPLLIGISPDWLDPYLTVANLTVVITAVLNAVGKWTRAQTGWTIMF